MNHQLRRGVGAINILSHDETKQDDMRRRICDSRVRFFLGDVRDYGSVASSFVNTDFVFHAAALMQVPSGEFFPQQAVKDQRDGQSQRGVSSRGCWCSLGVFLSTDKAVYPVNAMGMSKALMEKTAQPFVRNNPRSKTTVAVTRYGNVMYSRGSVIPLFIQRLQLG